MQEVIVQSYTLYQEDIDRVAILSERMNVKNKSEVVRRAVALLFSQTNMNLVDIITDPTNADAQVVPVVEARR